MYNNRMRLSDYFKNHKCNAEDFAELIGVSDQAVYKYLSGERKPRDKEILAAIANATNGQVTANDFYNVPSAKKNGHKQ